jgi:RNA polymerase sigma-70 factor (ECF subfamily)
MVFAGHAAGDFRALPTEANGLPALGVYRRTKNGTFAPYALHVLDISDGRVRGFTAFIDTRFFSYFGFPL